MKHGSNTDEGAEPGPSSVFDLCSAVAAKPSSDPTPPRPKHQSSSLLPLRALRASVREKARRFSSCLSQGLEGSLLRFHGPLNTPRMICRLHAFFGVGLGVGIRIFQWRRRSQPLAFPFPFDSDSDSDADPELTVSPTAPCNTPRTLGGTSAASPRPDCLLVSPRPRITRPSPHAPAASTRGLLTDSGRNTDCQNLHP